MSDLQDALLIRGNRIKNRLVMEPMFTFSYHGDDGHFYGQQHLEHYAARARGGVGLIILQATQCFGATAGTGQWTDYDKGILRAIAESCRDSGAAVMMQLACGDTDINALSGDEVRAMQREMTSAAVTAWELGMNGAEFHLAHGFTLCKFIDAAANQRTDEYGGCAENRARVLTGILEEIRAKTGEAFMLGVRMGEFLPESRDGLELARLFELSGIDLLNISFGMTFQDGPVPLGFICSSMAFSGCRVRQVVDKTSVIAAGGLRTEEQIRFLIEHDYVDFAGIGTALLADPSFADAVIHSRPPVSCLGCARCQWFTDHTKCPAGTQRP